MPDGTDLGPVVQVLPRIVVCKGGEVHAASLIASLGGADKVAGLHRGEARLLKKMPVRQVPGKPPDYRLYAVHDDDWDQYLDLGEPVDDV